MSKISIILLAVLIIIIIAGAGIYYFYSVGSFTKLINNFETPLNNNQNPEENTQRKTFLAVEDLEYIKEEFPETIEGIIKVSDGKEIKHNLGDTVEHTLYAVIVTAGDKDYTVVGYDESEYDSVGIKDDQKVKVQGIFLDKSKTLLLAGAIIPI